MLGKGERGMKPQGYGMTFVSPLDIRKPILDSQTLLGSPGSVQFKETHASSQM